jgi:DNA repair protein SbcD/Mre11
MIRLIHTADVHIGRPFRFLGEFGRTVRAQIRETFARVLTLARDRGANVVLISGDLFDSHRADRSDIRFILDQIRGIQPIPVCLLPGTHDLLVPDSVYRALRDRPENLHLFEGEDVQTVHFQDIGLAVHARANRARRGGVPPLEGIRPHPQARYNVAMAHASIPLGHLAGDQDHDYFVSEANIQAAGVQYCALGHWHKCAEYFPGNPFRAWYCGSPETLQFEDGEDSGYALEVILDSDRTEVVPRRVGRYEWREVALEVVPEAGLAGTEGELDRLAGPDRIVRVALRGALPATAVLDPDALGERFVGRFAHLILETVGLRTRWEDFDPQTVFPAGTVGAAFVTLAQERLSQAAEGDRVFWEEVLRRGTALLAGREDVGE